MQKLHLTSKVNEYQWNSEVSNQITNIFQMENLNSCQITNMTQIFNST